MSFPDFIKIAREYFTPFAEIGYALEEVRLCRAEVHLKLSRGNILIDLGYEPYGPPWCFVTENKDWREVRVNTGNEAGRALATGTNKSTEMATQHEEDIRRWCFETYEALRTQKGLIC